MSASPLRLRLYVASTVLVAIAAVLIAVLRLDRSFDPVWLVGSFIALAAIENAILAVRVRKGREAVSLLPDEALLVVMVLLLSPVAALAIYSAGVLIGEVALRHAGWFKRIFNTAQMVGSAALAIAVIEALGPGGEVGMRRILAVLVGALVFFVVNRSAVTGVLAIAGGESFRAHVLDDLGGAAATWTGAVSFGVLAGLTGIAYPWALPFALVGLMALIVALTGHVRAQHDRQALGEIVGSTAAVIFSVDPRGCIRTWNTEMERITGIPAGEASGTNVTDLVHLLNANGSPADDALSPDHLADACERRLVRLQSASHGERWLTLSRASLPDGGFAFVAQDMTEQRLAEKAAAESEERLIGAEEKYRRFVEHLPLAVYVDLPKAQHSIAGTTTSYISPQIEPMLGYPATDFLSDSKFYAGLIHPDDRERVEADVARARRSSERFSGEYRLVANDGRAVWVHDESIYIRDDAGAITSVEGYLVDVSERKTLESDLAQAQKMEAIGQLAGGVAHDFNNMMSAVIGFSDLALARLEDGHPIQQHLAEIHQAGVRASELTHQLLAFSRKQVLQPKVLDLNTIVAEAEKLLGRLIGEDIELVTILDPELAPVEADPGQLGQVLMNLAVNARDAMPAGGRLTVETANVEIGDDHAGAHVEVAPGRYVRLTVSDTGIGMDMRTQAHIFEPFFTTKEQGEGTGLGLATVFGIVKQSGGHVSVDSEPGRGTTFTIYLPRTGALPSSVPRRPTREAASRRGRETILVVEDEELVRNLERETLEMHGYTVLEARDGKHALALARDHHGPIHLLLTDVVMPGMSGRDLAEHLTGMRPEIQVLYASGYADEANGRHGVLEPDIAFLAKPLTPSSLTLKVREVLDTSRT